MVQAERRAQATALEAHQAIRAHVSLWCMATWSLAGAYPGWTVGVLYAGLRGGDFLLKSEGY